MGGFEEDLKAFGIMSEGWLARGSTERPADGLVLCHRLLYGFHRRLIIAPLSYSGFCTRVPKRQTLD